MKRRSLLASGAALAVPGVARAAMPVDVLLVLAIDISRSIVESDARLQRNGYRGAFLDARVQDAIRGGTTGAIGVAYVEWAAFDAQELLLPWTRIASPADAQAWGDALAAKPWSSRSWTSLSGDGVNNNGPQPDDFRDALVERGVVINGLPIINDRPRWGRPNGEELVPFYRDSVAGGPGHFVIVADGFDTFADAIKRKLVQEIS